METATPVQNLSSAWNIRLKALRNVPPVLRIVWESGPAVVVAGSVLRLLSALIPLAMLDVTRLIIDAVVQHVAVNHPPLRPHFWWLVVSNSVWRHLVRSWRAATDYCDTLLADKFTRHISIRIMEHASRLDLSSYEDPVFYDKLERARVQATDRLGMMQAVGRVMQQMITTATLAVGHCCLFSLASAHPDCLRRPGLLG